MVARTLGSALALALLGVTGCGGGGGGGAPAPTAQAAPAPPAPAPPAPTPQPGAGSTRTVTVSWAPNRETAVNRPGGGYHVLVDGTVVATVPFGSGPLAPTETTVELPSGTHVIQVRAFSNLNGGTTSAPSAPVAVTVP